MEKKPPQELQDIVDRLKAGLEGVYEDRLRGVYLYGSYSRGDARAGSDIDVLIVLDRMDSSWDEIKRTSELRADLSLEHDVTLNTLFVAEEQWKRDDVSVLRAVRREGILV